MNSTHRTLADQEIAGAGVAVAVALGARVMIPMIGTVGGQSRESPRAFLAGRSRVSLGTLAHLDRTIGRAVRRHLAHVENGGLKTATGEHGRTLVNRRRDDSRGKT